MQINKNIIYGLLGGGVTIVLGSFGGLKLNDKITYDRNVRYFGELNNRFTMKAPEGIKKDFYMPRWEDNGRWKKVHERANGKIMGRIFTTYEEMRDACYEFVKKDKNLDKCSDTNSYCTECTWGKDWS